MKTKVFLKTVALSAVILFGGIAASAANKNNLIYNTNTSWSNGCQQNAE